MWRLAAPDWRVWARWRSFYARKAVVHRMFHGATQVVEITAIQETSQWILYSETKKWPKSKLPSCSWCCCSLSPATCASCGQSTPPNTASLECITSWSTWASQTLSSQSFRSYRSSFGTSHFVSMGRTCFVGLWSTSRSWACLHLLTCWSWCLSTGV